MQIVIGSKNPIKIQASQEAFESFFEDIQVLPVSVDTGVKPFPTSQYETLQGALNRARAAQAAQPKADFAIGIEAGITLIQDFQIVQGFATIIKEQKIGIGGSVAFEAPHKILSKIDPTQESSKQKIDEILRKPNLLQKEGVVGIITKNRLTRMVILRDAVICALARFVSSKFYLG